MLTSPPDIFAKANQLKLEAQNFVMASVIAVRGAASAKTGSKALFDSEGKNILGWVGGGCAESFLARESLEVLKTKSPRIVTVDLDDEVFGLMPCGGVMDVYLEPHFAASQLTLPDMGRWNASVTQFIQQLGYDVAFTACKKEISNWADAFKETAIALAIKNDRALVPWRNLKGQGETELPWLRAEPAQLTVLGQTRITEELCRLSKLLEFPVKVFAQNPEGSAFPVGTSVCELPIDISSITLPQGSWVIVASHHQLDHKFIAHALTANAEYVALVASEKRTGLIHTDLKANGFSDLQLNHFFAPAGLVMPTETPTQIALSILCEILFLQNGGTPWI
ncbi:MAG: XdhC family protein [Bdellovibrionales bacterium]